MGVIIRAYLRVTPSDFSTKYLGLPMCNKQNRLKEGVILGWLVLQPYYSYL